MKDNAKKIMLLSYAPQTPQPLPITYQHLKLFLPHLTGSGLRSLVAALKRDGHIEVERVVDQTLIRLTNQGRQEVEAQFPFFRHQDAEDSQTAAASASDGGISWATLIFLQAPPGDQQFRYLRSLLVKYRAISLIRGVYLYPFHFPPLVMDECRSRYSDSVVIGQLQKWSIGDDRAIAINHFHVLDLIQSYSGISKDIDRLIERKKLFRELNHQEKNLLCSLFDRWYSNIQEDYGLIHYYFPHVSDGPELLNRLQSLLN